MGRVKGDRGRRLQETPSSGEAGVPREVFGSCDDGAMATTHNKQANRAIVNRKQGFGHVYHASEA
jgi:hypothetical protein